MELLDEADVYILDMGVKLLQWNGRRSNKDERFRAAAYMNQMKQGRGTCQSDTFDQESLNCVSRPTSGYTLHFRLCIDCQLKM